MSSPQNMSENTGTERRPRWKDHDDVIHFILKRTIPDHPVPRGETKALYHSVAREVRENFNLRGLIDYTGIKYVTEKYGSDPVYGNRKMSVIYPARTGTDNTPGARDKTFRKARRAVENGDGKYIICPHCEGHGFLEVIETGHQVDSGSQDDQGAGSSHLVSASQVVSGAPHMDPSDLSLGVNPSRAYMPTSCAAGTSYEVPQPSQTEPMSGPGRTEGLLSLDGRNVMWPAAEAVTYQRPAKRPRIDNQAEEEPGYPRASVAPYGNSLVGDEPASKRPRVDTAEQPSTMGIRQGLSTSVGPPSGQQVMVDDNAHYLNNQDSTGNAVSGYDSDYAFWDPSILDFNYGANSVPGADQNHASNVAAPAESSSGAAPPAITEATFNIEEFDFGQFLNEYGDLSVPDLQANPYPPL
ncbi:hypothetical protein F5Y06DRAFT_295697 [Hypoxylon sp. FL0890]|nr:hypothetical protein F5Y06DRAFT_295697 [Hypoxylon sp. FL0890]